MNPHWTGFHWTTAKAVRVVRIRNGLEKATHLEHLLSLPAHRPGRAKTRDLVPFSGKTLARLCKPLSSPTMAFAGPRKGDRLGPLPTYRDWLRSVGALPLKTYKRKSKPMFEESAPEPWLSLPTDYERIAA